MPLWDLKQAALETGVSPHTLRSWTRLGYVPHVRIGRLIRFEPMAVKAWIERQAKAGRDMLKPELSRAAQAGAQG